MSKTVPGWGEPWYWLQTSGWADLKAEPHGASPSRPRQTVRPTDRRRALRAGRARTIVILSTHAQGAHMLPPLVACPAATATALSPSIRLTASHRSVCRACIAKVAARSRPAPMSRHRPLHSVYERLTIQIGARPHDAPGHERDRISCNPACCCGCREMT